MDMKLLIAACVHFKMISCAFVYEFQLLRTQAASFFDVLYARVCVCVGWVELERYPANRLARTLGFAFGSTQPTRWWTSPSPQLIGVTLNWGQLIGVRSRFMRAVTEQAVFAAAAAPKEGGGEGAKTAPARRVAAAVC
ncbi:MAG: hypothetical protein Q4G71_08050 [Pseudomonadota bacterium]|nr:hypothetical protein [Pseudomonadota bacterium]